MTSAGELRFFVAFVGIGANLMANSVGAPVSVSREWTVAHAPLPKRFPIFHCDLLLVRVRPTGDGAMVRGVVTSF